MRANLAELVDGGKAAHDDPVTEHDVSAECCIVGQHALVADRAVVRHVDVSHEQVVVADRSDAFVLGRAQLGVISRITFRSPIVSRVGSPRYFLSCGAEPTDANWNTTLSVPIVVGPWITTCGPMRVRAPISTPSLITE
jgi:hypothetical protein